MLLKRIQALPWQWGDNNTSCYYFLHLIVTFAHNDCCATVTFPRCAAFILKQVKQPPENDPKFILNSKASFGSQFFLLRFALTALISLVSSRSRQRFCTFLFFPWKTRWIVTARHITAETEEHLAAKEADDLTRPNRRWKEWIDFKLITENATDVFTGCCLSLKEQNDQLLGYCRLLAWLI